MKKILLALLVASIYHWAWAAERPLNTKQCIIIPAGEKDFSVVLHANATTGFSWQLLAYDQQRLKLVSKHYQPSEPHLMGSPGLQYFTFQLNASVTTAQCGEIRLTYARPWEHQAGPIKTVTWCYKARANNEMG